MRNLVDPPPISRCKLCRGELLLKGIEKCGPHIDLDIQMFVCAKCGQEQVVGVARNYHMPIVRPSKHATR